ncbi:hypothetical protein MPSEU_000730400 [Mayamaea pseudoterrestris]|nr:hypothetical protein MPSEU_000730400 [Mayamaea pseudoterrestris]
MSHAQENLPAGIKVRLAAYQEALKRKRELQKQTILGADTDDIKRSYHNEINGISPSRAMSPVKLVGRVDRDKMKNFQFELPDVEPDAVELEQEARDNLHRMFQVVQGDNQDNWSNNNHNYGHSPSLLNTWTRTDSPPAFNDNRLRYLDVVETLVPAPLPPESGEPKKRAVLTEIIKKEAYGSLKNAWDDYEVAALDRPRAPPDPEEKVMRERIAKVEDRIDMAWVQYAQEIVTRAVTDGDTDEAEIDQWQDEAKRMEKESRRRRKRKEKQEKLEEEQYWKDECERLQQVINDRSDESELGSDEEWLSDVSDPDEGVIH